MKRFLSLSVAILFLLTGISFGAEYHFIKRRWTPASPTSGGVTASHWYSPSHTNYQDSARTTLVAADGDVTGSPTDKMVAADHLSQTTTANKPIYKVNISGGKPMWLCDGTDFFQGAFTTGGAVAQALTIFAVAKLDATVINDSNYIILVDGDDAVTRLFIGKNSVTTPDGWIQWAGASLDGNAANANYNVWSAVFNGASSSFRINGVLEKSGDAGAQGIDGLTIGHRYADAGLTTPWKGYIGDVIIYPGALSTVDLNQIGQWLATFYGLTWTAIP